MMEHLATDGVYELWRDDSMLYTVKRYESGHTIFPTSGVWFRMKDAKRKNKKLNFFTLF